MIYANKEMIRVKGARAEVLTEFSEVCLTMKDEFMKYGKSEAEAKQLLQKSLEMAFMSEEEINEMLSRILEKMERMV